MREIIPTIVPLSADDCASRVAMLSTFAPSLHIDAVDGVFAPNSTWMPGEGQRFAETNAFYEVHLMVSDPHAVGIAFARAGAMRIIAQAEAFGSSSDIEAAFAAWRAAGAVEVGLAVLIDTPIEALAAHVEHCDSILFMTIAHVGRQGASFDSRAVPRIAEFVRLHPESVIAADGGITEEVIPALAHAGVTRFCVGAAIATAAEPGVVYKRLSEAANAI
jgi:ribulose-phosphate 3-epimerase